MTKAIILVARHGRTFEPHQTSTFLGRQNDMDLSAAGLEDAQALAEAIALFGHPVSYAFCGPLRRARRTAAVALGGLPAHEQPVLKVDERLDELDYGDWTGKSHADLMASSAQTELTQWQQTRQWPSSASFQPEPQAVSEQLQQFFSELTTTLVRSSKPSLTLVVSHSGRLRFLCDLWSAKDESEWRSKKLSCGHLAVLAYAGGEFTCLDFNVAPKTWAQTAKGSSWLRR